MSSRGESFAPIIERERGLRRTLSARRMSMIAIGGAIGTGLVLGSGFAISLAGPAVLVSYLVGALIALLLMGCLAEMTVAHPTSGSFGAYAEYYLGPLAGFLVRYAYWPSIVLAVGTEVTAVALYMHFWFPASPGWSWIVGFSALLVLVNARSVNVFGAIEYWFSAIKVTAILLFIPLAAYIVVRAPGALAGAVAVPGAPTPGFQNYTALGGFFPHGLWGAWVAVIVAIFSYLSIEMIAVAAGEAAQPEIEVMRALQVPAAAGIFNFVILVAALSAMNSQLYITTRMMFSLSRAGYAPHRFGVLNQRGVPGQALLLSSLGIALATLLSVLAPKSAFRLMIAISSFGAMFTWMMIFVTHFAFRRARERSGVPLRFRMPGYPATTLLGAALMAAVLLTTAFTDAFRLTLFFGVPFLVALVVCYWLWYRRGEAAAVSSSESA